MKRTTVLQLHHSGLYRLFVENTALVCFSVLFVCSVLAGSIFFRFGYFESVGESCFRRLILQLCTENFGVFFCSQVLFNLSFLLLLYFFGTSMLGVAFIPGMIVLRGLLTGWLLSRLYQMNGLYGIVWNLLIVIPGELLLLPALLFGAGCSLNLSLSLSRFLIYHDTPANQHRTDLFFKRLLLLGFIVISGCFLRSLLFEALSSYFELR